MQLNSACSKPPLPHCEVHRERPSSSLMPSEIRGRSPRCSWLCQSPCTVCVFLSHGMGVRSLFRECGQKKTCRLVSSSAAKITGHYTASPPPLHAQSLSEASALSRFAHRQPSNS